MLLQSIMKYYLGIIMYSVVKKIVFLILVCLLFSNDVVFAEDKILDAKINLENIKESKDNITFDIKVKISNKSLVNDSLFISYHILDRDKNVIQFENERKKIVFDNLDSEKNTFIIDLNSLYKYDKEEIIIQFDIVDITNLYWFSQNKSINFQPEIYNIKINLSDLKKNIISQNIPKMDENSKNFKERLNDIMLNLYQNKVVFVLNILFFIIVLLFLYKLRRILK